MEEILHQLIGSLSQYFQGFIFYISQVVQDFFHRQYGCRFSMTVVHWRHWFPLKVSNFMESAFMWSFLHVYSHVCCGCFFGKKNWWAFLLTPMTWTIFHCNCLSISVLKLIFSYIFQICNSDFLAPVLTKKEVWTKNSQSSRSTPGTKIGSPERFLGDS